MSTKDICYSELGISILRIHLFNWDLDYMIPAGNSHTSVPNPQYEFQKRKIQFQQFFLYFEFGNCILLNSGLAISKKRIFIFPNDGHEFTSSVQNYQGLKLLYKDDRKKFKVA